MIPAALHFEYEMFNPCDNAWLSEKIVFSFIPKWNEYHGPTNARLYHMAGGGKTGAWSSRTNDQSQYIQVDFGEVKRVTQVASQGRQDAAQWVTKFKVSYSTFGKVFNSQDHVSYQVIFVQSKACLTVDSFSHANIDDDDDDDDDDY